MSNEAFKKYLAQTCTVVLPFLIIIMINFYITVNTSFYYSCPWFCFLFCFVFALVVVGLHSHMIAHCVNAHHKWLQGISFSFVQESDIREMAV